MCQQITLVLCIHEWVKPNSESGASMVRNFTVSSVSTNTTGFVYEWVKPDSESGVYD